MLLDLPNEILLYIFKNFLDLSDIWSLYQTNSSLRKFVANIIQTNWKIDLKSNQNIMKIQCRSALIVLEALVAQKNTPIMIEFLIKDDIVINKKLKEFLKREENLHKNIIQGISSYKHQFVLIEDIDLRNRIRLIIDLIFHHTVFVVKSQHRIFAMMMIRLLTKLDRSYSYYCKEITFTLVDNIKAFLEFTGYKLLAHKHINHTLNSISACFDLIGAAFIGKILTENHLDCAVKRISELLSNHVEFKRNLLLDLLNHWISIKRESTELSRYIKMEIEKCNRYL